MHNLPPFSETGKVVSYEYGVRPVDEQERNNVIFKATSTHLGQKQKRIH